MSSQAFNYYLHDLDITGLAPDVFYDFSSYSSEASYDFVDSVESGNSLYSGKITDNVASFTGNVSGSGYFTNQHVEISHTTGLTSTVGTFLFSHQKSGGNNATIFSNLSGQSGYEFGINEANKLYFNQYVDGIPAIKTFDIVAAEKNIYGLQVGNGAVVMQRLDPSQYENGQYLFESQTFDIPTYGITNTANWNLGSGEYQYEGWMDYFLYFKQEVPEEKLEYMANSLYQNYSLSSPVTGATLAELTGISITSSGITGELGQSGLATGTFTNVTGYTYSVGTPVTGSAGISGTIFVPITGILDKAYSGAEYGWMHDIVYQKIENLNYILGTGGLEVTGRTGFLSSGSEVFGNWLFDGRSGTYEGETGIGPSGTLFGITGFSFSPVSVSVTGGSGNLLGSTGITGDLYSGYTVSGIYGPSGVYTGTGAIEGVSGGLPSGYLYDYLDNVVDEGTTGFFERISTQEVGFTNKIGSLLQIADTDITYVSTTGAQSVYQTNFYINGVARLSGIGSEGRNAFNAPYYSSTQDYFVSGFTRLVDNLVLDINDDPLHDYNQTGNRSGIVTITGIGDYGSAPFAQIEDFGEKQIFFNGIKIYSGIGYIDNGGFYPTGAITGATGVYFAYPIYNNASTFTGEGVSLFEINNTPFKVGSHVMYLNGVRYPLKNFVAHAGDVDLITGKIVVDETLTAIYNNYITYETY